MNLEDNVKAFSEAMIKMSVTAKEMCDALNSVVLALDRTLAKLDGPSTIEGVCAVKDYA